MAYLMHPHFTQEPLQRQTPFLGLHIVLAKSLTFRCPPSAFFAIVKELSRSYPLRRSVSSKKYQYAIVVCLSVSLPRFVTLSLSKGLARRYRFAHKQHKDPLAPHSAPRLPTLKCLAVPPPTGV